MKSKASMFLKQMLSTIVAVVKAKSTAVRAKTSTLKTRLLVLGILRNKKLLVSAINHRIHAIMGQQQQHDSARHHDHLQGSASASQSQHAEEDDGGSKKSIVLYTAPSYVTERDVDDAQEQEEEGSDDDEYLTHSLFRHEDDDDDELVNAPGSVIDVVRDAKEKECAGAEFRLEDEIDHVADVFIRRIHKNLKLQKLESFKRFCEMMERSTS